MKAPQIIMAIWMGAELLLAAHLHGNPKFNPNYSFWNEFIDWACLFALLSWGGFWS